MPLYEYRCAKCGHEDSIFKKTFDPPKSPSCTRKRKCPGRMKRLISRTKTHLDYDTPVLSDSMGVAPSQVAEHRQLHPDIPLTDDGRVIVTSHREQKRIMKRLGFFDKKAYY